MGSSCWPRSWTPVGSSTWRRSTAGRRSTRRSGVPFRASFACLWCGAAHVVRSPDDLEGWAQLCPDCVGKAGDNGFLRFRLKQALAERGAAARAGGGPDASAPADPAPGDPAATAGRSAVDAGADAAAEMRAYYEARAPEYDDWYLRRGRYAHGAIDDAVWNADLAVAGRWLDGLPLGGELVELAAGTGWWSPLLASRGELSLYDTSPTALDRARDRLVAHGLRAHLHVRDAWDEPDRQVDGVFAGFWLSHVERDRLLEFLALVRRWLRPGGRLAFIDSLPDHASSARDHPRPADDRSLRRLADGRAFTIVKVYRSPTDFAEVLAAAGFVDIQARTTSRFFVLGTAVSP